MNFDPDAYLAKKQGFNPDAYLQKKGVVSEPKEEEPKNDSIGKAYGMSFLDNALVKGIIRQIAPSEEDAEKAIEYITNTNEKNTEAFKVGIGRGLKDRYEGTKQLLTPDNPERDAKIKAEREAYEQTEIGKSQLGDTGRFIGDTAPLMALGGPSKSALQRIVTGGGIGGTVGATEFVDEDKNESRTENTLKGIATGLIIGGTAEGVMQSGNKAVNALSGKFKNKQTGELVSLSKKHNVPLSFGDMSNGPISPKVETSLEYVPVVGMGGFRQVQGKAAAQSADDLKSMFSSRVKSGDPTQIPHTSLINKLNKNREFAGERYKKVSELADPAGAIPASNMQKTAQEAINKELAREPHLQDAQIIKVFEKYAKNPNVNFSGLRELRSEVGDMVSDYYKGTNSVVGSKGVGKLEKLKKAIEKDLETAANSMGGQVKASWKKADSFYKRNVVPYKTEADIRRAIDSKNPDEILNTFIKPGKRDRAMRLYSKLDKEGRAGVRYLMIDDAIAKATDEKGIFHPAKFALQMERNSDPVKVFFRGKDYQEVKGFSKLMRHAEKSGRYMADPPTGARTVPFLAAGGAGYGLSVEPVSVVAGTATVASLSKLFTTKSGQQLLLAMGRAKEGSTGFNRLVEKAVALASSEASQ